MEKLKDKDQIIKAYKQAKTITELKNMREQTRASFNKLISCEQTQIKAEFKNRMEKLECMN